MVENYLLLDRFSGAFESGWPITVDIVVPISSDTYLLKTIWIRLVQRHWKKTFALLQRRKSLVALRYRELKGNWPVGLKHPPTIHGLMSVYSRIQTF